MNYVLFQTPKWHREIWARPIIQALLDNESFRIFPMAVENWKKKRRRTREKKNNKNEWFLSVLKLLRLQPSFVLNWLTCKTFFNKCCGGVFIKYKIFSNEAAARVEFSLTNWTVSKSNFNPVWLNVGRSNTSSMPESSTLLRISCFNWSVCLANGFHFYFF